MTRLVADQAVLRDLAPTGALRVAVNMANAALVKSCGDGSLSGIIPDVSEALARRLGVPVEFVRYPSGGTIIEDIGFGRWDLTVLAEDPARADRLTFSRPIAQIEAAFAVLQGSPLTHVDQADRAGLLIATTRNAAYELHLKRSLAHAQIASHDTPTAALESVLSGGCDLVAGIRDALAKAAATHGRLRVLEGAFLVLQQTIALERDRVAGATFVDSFLCTGTASPE